MRINEFCCVSDYPQERYVMTNERLYAYIERAVTERHLAGDKVQLNKLQTACGVIMAAAQDANQPVLAKQFQILAARAANLAEEISDRR
jgi:hypothetical protein